MAAGDTTELLADVRERGSIGSDDLRFTDAKLLTAATKELREGVAPLLHAARSEHGVYAYSTSVAASTSTVRIPPRALGGGGLREVRWQSASATRSTPLVEVSADRAHEWEEATGTPSNYYVRNASVVLLPTPDAAGTLHMPYYSRPNTLVATSSAWQVTAIAGEEMTLSAASCPATVDVVRGTPGFETLASDTAVTTVSASVRSFTSTTAAAVGVAVGDWLCTAGESPVVQAPLELHGLLAARTVRRVLKAAGDVRWQDYEADVAELTALAQQWLSPRNSGASQAAAPAQSGLMWGLIR